MNKIDKRLKLTIRQELCLDGVKSYIKRYGFPPSHAEIAEIMNIRSTRGAQDHLRAIEKKGYIKIHNRIPRGIQVLSEEDE